MSNLKCKECGMEFNSNLEECPNCGCPASECSVVNKGVNSSPQKKQQVNLPKAKSTDPFEIVCYVLAGICAVLFFFTSTTRSGYVNFDGSFTALQYEIAAFAWLITGRITAVINK